MTDAPNDLPLIVQGDFTVLLEVANARFREARESLLAFAELVKSPEHFHTYRITPLSIWNACAAGMEPGKVLEKLEELARYRVPGNVAAGILIGTYVEQIEALAERLGAPVLSGTSSQRRRDELYAAFRNGRLPALAVTKIANFAVDLPDASLAIQVSGTFGSRQEEAQRLGRLLRPKAGANQAHFYSLVTSDTKEQEFALRRQLFLCEQGYAYEIVEGEELLAQGAEAGTAGRSATSRSAT